MRGQSACAVCCGGLCQHPECWRSNIQQVREAVWRRNGVKPHGESHESDGSCLQKEQHIDSRYGKFNNWIQFIMNHYVCIEPISLTCSAGRVLGMECVGRV